MSPLALKAYLRIVGAMIGVALLLFGAAAGLDFTEAWVFLATNLVGYVDYQTKVRVRLVPLIW